MSKQNSKRQTALRSTSRTTGDRISLAPTARKATKLKAGAQPAVGQQQRSLGKQPGHPDTKQARIIAMLRTAGGATIETMTRATGWQQHSVRGFLAAIVRKKLGLILVSTAAEGGQFIGLRMVRTRMSLQKQPARRDTVRQLIPVARAKQRYR